MRRVALIFLVMFFLLSCAPLEMLSARLAGLAPSSTTTAPSTASPTHTPILTATATRDPLKEAILYEDDFSNDGSGWGAENTKESRFYYSKGEYFIQANTSDFFTYITSVKTFDNYVMSVDLRHVVGDDQSSGGMLLWRYKGNGDFFALSVLDDGSYFIERFLKGKYGMLRLPAVSPWLNTAGKTNKITLAVHDGTYDIYFNDHFETSFTDDSLKGGNIGMGATPALTSSVEVAFDNLLLAEYDPANAFTPDRPALTPTPEYQSISWAELVQFLSDDHTNWHAYDLEDYNCMDFAIDLVASARADNIAVNIVTVQFVGQPIGHAFASFDTTDRGPVFVEPQEDSTYSNVDVGSLLCDDWGASECMGVIESVEYFGDCNHAQNCTVVR